MLLILLQTVVHCSEIAAIHPGVNFFLRKKKKKKRQRQQAKRNWLCVYRKTKATLLNPQADAFYTLTATDTA